MNWVILVRPRAERDLETARDWYERRRAGLGDEFLDEVAAGMRVLDVDPVRERRYYREFRRILLRRFPAEYAAAAVRESLPGLPIHIVSLDTLLTMKRAAGRPHDLADIDELSLLHRKPSSYDRES
jgi:hypothetical protein